MKRLSIIVPFYNVENYLKRCLDSLLDQDIPIDEYEIIGTSKAFPTDHDSDGDEQQHKNLIGSKELGDRKTFSDSE